VCSARKVVSAPVFSVVAILADSQKQLMALELCDGESFDAWKGVLNDLVARGAGCPRDLRDRWPHGAAEGGRARLAPGEHPALCRLHREPCGDLERHRGLRAQLAASRREATSCSPSSSSPRANGRHSGPQMKVSRGVHPLRRAHYVPDSGLTAAWSCGPTTTAGTSRSAPHSKSAVNPAQGDWPRGRWGTP
jgi:hypothetical protein